MVAIATAILISQGYTPNSADDLDHRALLLVTACTAPGPRAAPTGAECIAALSAIWATETAGTWSIYPPHNGTGCGPLQVVPVSRWGNNRTGRFPLPTCAELRVPSTGIAWGLRVLRAKAHRFTSWRARFRAYNGSSNADNYAASALRRFYR